MSKSHRNIVHTLMAGHRGCSDGLVWEKLEATLANHMRHVELMALDEALSIALALSKEAPRINPQFNLGYDRALRAVQAVIVAHMERLDKEDAA